MTFFLKQRNYGSDNFFQHYERCVMNRYIFLVIVFVGFSFNFLCASNLISCKSYVEIQSMMPNLAIEDIDSFIRPCIAIDKTKFEGVTKENACFVNMFGCEIKSFAQVKERLKLINIQPCNVIALNVSNNEIKNITVEDVKDFENLQFFSAYNNEIENIDSNVFYKTKISTLMLSDNALTDLLFFNPILFSQRSFLFNFAENLVNSEKLRECFLRAAVVNTQEFVDIFKQLNIASFDFFRIQEHIAQALENDSYVDNQLDPIIFLSRTEHKNDGLLRINKEDSNLWEKYKKLLVIHHNTKELYDLISGNKLLVKPIFIENKLIIFKNIIGYFDENAPEPEVEEFDLYQYIAQLYVTLNCCGIIKTMQ